MSIKLNSSFKLNKEFNNRASFIAINAGVDLHIAKNCIRWQRANKTQKTAKVWKDPKTGLALSFGQWESPSQKLARKVRQGTNEDGGRYHLFFDSEQPAEVTWSDALDNGMFYANKSGVNILLTREQANALMAQYVLESTLPVMQGE